MALPQPLLAFFRRTGWVERIFILFLVAYLLLFLLAPASGWFTLTQFLTFILGMVVAIRILRVAASHAIWRLRNRLIVTYLFIGGVPIVLIAALIGLSLYAIVSQVAVYLVTSELERRVDALRSAAESIIRTDPPSRVETMRRMSDLFYKDRFPGVTMLLRTSAGVARYPAESDEEPPTESTPNLSGVVYKDGVHQIWAHTNFNGGDITVIAPMASDQLSSLVPHLGIAQFIAFSNHPTDKAKPPALESTRSRQATAQLPPSAFRFDVAIRFGAFIPVVFYGDSRRDDVQVLSVTSRLSAVYNVLFSRKSDTLQEFLTITFVVVSVAFLIVEIISLIVGISMTRTITGTIHNLYEGTQHVIQGDFSHRIEVKGRDQLSGLGHSFNLMTERIEKLLAVAKEKERLQSEIEIAREVQGQLYPKKVPDVRSLRLTAVCKPARMVSGDYFDYECVYGRNVALAIGDVAGKGISAALLMATLQSSLRTELRASTDWSPSPANGLNGMKPISTSKLVSHLNEQLHAYTSPEKYATFYLGLFDEATGVLRYTNAGHLPPILVRKGEATRLNVDGTVVGAFPFAQYDESEISLESGDLLVCFTDGVSEPENEFGEMFGEDRLVDLVIRNAHRPEAEIVDTIITAVEQWTGSPELQDDMTLLLARRE